MLKTNGEIVVAYVKNNQMAIGSGGGGGGGTTTYVGKDKTTLTSWIHAPEYTAELFRLDSSGRS